MGENEVKMLHRIIGEMSSKSANTDQTIEKIVNQFQVVGGYLQHLEQGVFALSRELNIVKKTNEMVLNMFLESGVYSKEELDEKFEKEVVAPIRALDEERHKKMEEAIAAHIAQQEAQAPGVVAAVEETAYEVSDEEEPVLASERNNVIVFGRKEEEHE
jgi:hypothetical protein